MKNKESVLLYPGGVREVTRVTVWCLWPLRRQQLLHILCGAPHTAKHTSSCIRCFFASVQAYKNKGEKYKVIWPEEPEFVRVAARFGATIIPVGAVGCEDRCAGLPQCHGHETASLSRHARACMTA